MSFEFDSKDLKNKSNPEKRIFLFLGEKEGNKVGQDRRLPTRKVTPEISPSLFRFHNFKRRLPSPAKDRSRPHSLSLKMFRDWGRELAGLGKR